MRATFKVTPGVKMLGLTEWKSAVPMVFHVHRSGRTASSTRPLGTMMAIIVVEAQRRVMVGSLWAVTGPSVELR